MRIKIDLMNGILLKKKFSDTSTMSVNYNLGRNRSEVYLGMLNFKR